MGTSISPATDTVNLSSINHLSNRVNALNTKIDSLNSQVSNLTTQFASLSTKITQSRDNVDIALEIKEKYESNLYKLKSAREALINHGQIVFYTNNTYTFNNTELLAGVHRFTNWPSYDKGTPGNSINSVLDKIIISGVELSGEMPVPTIQDYADSDQPVITEYNVSGLDTHLLTSMHSMFKGHWKLIYVDVSNFDTLGVTAMTDMFYGCTSLKELDLSNFDTSNVTNMDGLFHGCSSITSLKIGPNFFNAFSRTESPLNYISFSDMALWTNLQELMDLIKNLPTVDHTCTLEFHANTKAVLTANGLTKSANKKGWVID